MRVAVCDNDHVFLSEMKVILGKMNDVKEVDLYTTPAALINAVYKKSIYDVVLMDIDLQEENGLQWSERINRIIPKIPIIYLASGSELFSQYTMLAEANIVGYLTKPIDENVLRLYLEKAKKLKPEVRQVVISKQGNKMLINMDDIIHVESHNHQICIFTPHEVYTVYEKLEDIKNRLSEEFIQCHKSYIVNMNWIASLDRKSVLLRNGTEIPISRTHQNEVKETFLAFVKLGSHKIFKRTL